ncbi:MAG: SUMF1/EgtB/PvdO family nonheme iron enzyme [Syntrophobacteria bacterium]
MEKSCNSPVWFAGCERVARLVIFLTGAALYLGIFVPCRGLAGEVSLRSEPKNLTDRDIKHLLDQYNFYDSIRNPDGRFANRLVPGRYGNDMVVFDRATGLVWQQSGSETYMEWEGAHTYIQRLNERRFANFAQWRLPTVEELASLVESQKRNGRLYIDPAFDPHQGWCWSSDRRGEGCAYLVSYYHGMIDWKFSCGRVFVRAVASSARFRSQQEKPVVSEVEPPSATVYTNSIGMKFVAITPGTFTMGSPADEPGRSRDEGPRHQVTISRPFYLGTTEVTQGQWREVMGGNPSRFRGKDLPVENVSWNDCREFIRRLNEREQTTRYRLPTEAEWEYACRAGSDARFCFGEEDTGTAAPGERLGSSSGDRQETLEDCSWYGDVARNRTHPVARKRPNPWGLYDMHGNVAEWCADWYGTYPAADQTDPLGPPHGSRRVLRGGNYGCGPWSVRSARRQSAPPRSRSCRWGFRVALDAK